MREPRARMFHEDYSLAHFAVELEHLTGRRIPIARRNMKRHLKGWIVELLQGDGRPAAQVDADRAEFFDAIDLLMSKRRPDGVCVLDHATAPVLGLPPLHTVLALEAEHAAPLTRIAYYEYADFWHSLDCTDLYDTWNCAVIVIDRYGSWRPLCLHAMHDALLCLPRDGGCMSDFVRPPSDFGSKYAARDSSARASPPHRPAPE